MYGSNDYEHDDCYEQERPRRRRPLTRRKKHLIKRRQKLQLREEKRQAKIDARLAKKQAKISARLAKKQAKIYRKEEKRRRKLEKKAPEEAAVKGRQAKSFYDEDTAKNAKAAKKKSISAQKSIPYREMGRNGICRVQDKLYSKTIRFYDINYQLA
ncbi:MAG: conjugal transfer protein TraE, partial [Anaerotignum sp.]|nr:conjugal transfer protein TraE [Anaerotignum sp.]